MHKYLLLIVLLLTGSAPAERAADDRLLEGAEARIQQYRTAEATLHLTDAEGNPLPPYTTVHIEQTRHAFLFGCNLFELHAHWDPAVNAEYARRFKELLNYATLPFYWWKYEPCRDYVHEQKLMQMAQWCQANNITAKGHPLAWNHGDPKWLPDDPDEIMQLQMKRIHREMTRFTDLINIWDVVNEATDPHHENCLKQAPKLTATIDQVGPSEYVRRCFRSACRTDPDAMLIINDYRLDTDFEDLVLKKLVDDQGRPLYDAIGLQSHQHRGAFDLTFVWHICEQYARYGKPLHWTENSFVSGEEGWELNTQRENFSWTSTPEGEKRQAEQTVRFYTLLFSHPAVEAITWWNLSDYRCWMGAPASLLRADMSPKPAYNELYKLIKGKWWTKTETETGAGGKATFRGFYGDYRVTAEINGQPVAAAFTLSKDNTVPMTVRMTPKVDPEQK